MNIIVCLFVRLLAGSVVSHLPNAREFVRVANEAISVAHENAILEAKEMKLKSELEAQGVRVAGVAVNIDDAVTLALAPGGHANCSEILRKIPKLECLIAEYCDCFDLEDVAGCSDLKILKVVGGGLILNASAILRVPKLSEIFGLLMDLPKDSEVIERLRHTGIGVLMTTENVRTVVADRNLERFRNNLYITKTAFESLSEAERSKLREVTDNNKSYINDHIGTWFWQEPFFDSWSGYWEHKSIAEVLKDRNRNTENSRQE